MLFTGDRECHILWTDKVHNMCGIIQKALFMKLSAEDVLQIHRINFIFLQFKTISRFRFQLLVTVVPFHSPTASGSGFRKTIK